jgi:hypothetical protein
MKRVSWLGRKTEVSISMLPAAETQQKALKYQPLFLGSSVVNGMHDWISRMV